MQNQTAAGDDRQIQTIAFLNETGHVTITWDPQNDERVKELVRKKIKEGYTFFTLRKVVIDAIKVRRKVGIKGVDTIESLIIDDKDFDKMIRDIKDRDVAEILASGVASKAEIKDRASMDTVKRCRDADEVMRARDTVAVRPIAGG